MKIIKLLLAPVMMLALVMLFFSCKEKKKTQAGNEPTYTCPMHPQITQHEMGTCPICGMDLVLFDKNNVEASLTLSESQVILGNITTVTIITDTMHHYKKLNGRLIVDPDQTSFISSRVAGRVEALYVKEVGAKVNKGQPLYKIYAEQLGTLQQEYLLAVAQVKQFPSDKRFNDIERAARQKLLLYDQTEAQLNRLVQTQKADPYVTYVAPASGTVAELSVTEGQYVAEGGSIMRLEGYGKLWVQADLYPAEASVIKIGQRVQVIIPGWENQPQTTTIQFIDPAYQSGSQLLQARGTISNSGSQWQPGLQATILVPQKTKTDVLMLPPDAVVRDAKGAHVWIETERGKFVPRMVTTGTENADGVEIIDGIEEGEEVVVTGAYLLYSEYVLKKGADPMAGHQH